MDKMSKEAFMGLLRGVLATAATNVKTAELVAKNSNKALDRLAAWDPELVRLLKEGIADRGRHSQRVIDHIKARFEAPWR